MPLSCGSFSLDDVSSKTALCQAPAAFSFCDRALYRADPEPVTKAADLPAQLAFFSELSGAPQGLRYAAEFVSLSTEQELIAHIAALPLQPFQFGQYEGKRRVASFGFQYDYTLRRLQDAEPIPDWLGPIVKQVEAFGGPDTRIGQVLCTEYDEGVGIGWHRDKPMFEDVVALSFLAPCALRLRLKDGEKWKRHAVQIAPRSGYLLRGAVRTDWEHSITPMETLRYSVTFRSFRAGNPVRLA